MQEISAGILVYKRTKQNELQVLLGKCGGPAWEHRNTGAWNIPKGHVEADEPLLAAAIREFEEETGLILPKDRFNTMEYLGTAKTSGNKKIVHIYALEFDFNFSEIKFDSNLCETEYPRGSGNFIQVPELSIGKYLTLNEAESLIFPYQKVFLDRLFEIKQ
jgi:predicted NUDIX family NTP pyrophosphohydrolase